MNEIDNIKKILWKIKNAETFSRREVSTADYVRDVTFLLELIHKGQGMANEINILVTENKQMMGQIAKLTTVSDGDPLHVLREMTEEQRLSFLRWSREGGKP